MSISDEVLDELFREYERQEEKRCKAVNEQWKSRVPESMDSMVRALALGAIPAKPKLMKAVAAGSAAVALKVTAVAVASALTLGVGAYAVSPAVRDCVDSIISGKAYDQKRGPKDYVIPDPGEDYSLTDEASGENMTAKWFTSDKAELMVQIAYRLPEDPNSSENVDLVTVGPLWGTYQEAENTGLLILRDGEILILIETWGAERAELMSYAEMLVQSNIN